jgi:hypothetical protein
MREKSKTTIQSFSDKEMMQKDGFGEHLRSRYEKFLYLLRHSMYHIGELSRSLRERDNVKVIWR